MQDRELQILNVIRFQPDVQETLCHKAENPLVVIGITGNVQPLFQFKEDVKQPADRSDRIARVAVRSS